MSLRRKLTAVVFLLIEGTTIKFLWLQSREDTLNILQDKLVGGKFLSASFLSVVTAKYARHEKAKQKVRENIFVKSVVRQIQHIE